MLNGETHMQKLNLFNHEEFVKNTYIVTENYSMKDRFTMGVIVGAERVLMIDTGFGMAGDLRKYVESFVGTEKPIFCICTHGHSDVTGGAALFDEAYLKKEDVGRFPESVEPEQRLEQLSRFVSGNEGLLAYGKANMSDIRSVEWKDLKDGDHFHLGGVHVGIIEIPGHTPGSIAVRVTREGVTKSTFVGDAFTPGMNHFTRMDRFDLIAYSDRLERFMMKLEDSEPIYCTHSQLPMSKKAGLAIARACREVAYGKTAGDPIAQNDPALRCHFVGCYGILYNYKLANEGREV